MWAALRRRGVKELYSHQATAVDAALNGRHFVLSTATASGKSLAYLLPILVAAVAAAENAAAAAVRTLGPALASQLHPAAAAGDNLYTYHA